MIYVLVSDSFEHSSRYVVPMSRSPLVLDSRDRKDEQSISSCRGPQTNPFTATPIAAALMNVNFVCSILALPSNSRCMSGFRTFWEAAQGEQTAAISTLLSPATNRRAVDQKDPDISSTPPSPRSSFPKVFARLSGTPNTLGLGRRLHPKPSTIRHPIQESSFSVLLLGCFLCQAHRLRKRKLHVSICIREILLATPADDLAASGIGHGGRFRLYRNPLLRTEAEARGRGNPRIGEGRPVVVVRTSIFPPCRD